jgi:hypothetical protein
MTAPLKLYVYADETGQDTEGRLFIMVAIVVGDQRDAWMHRLEKIETDSGKGERKWIKTRPRERQTYLDQVLKSEQFPGRAYFQVFGEGKDYPLRTALVIAQALNLYRAELHLDAYEATVVIDGLSRQEALIAGATLRKIGVRTRKVRGARDESNALIRLADALAGMLRAARKGTETLIVFEQRARKLNLVIEL